MKTFVEILKTIKPRLNNCARSARKILGFFSGFTRGNRLKTVFFEGAAGGRGAIRGQIVVISLEFPLNLYTILCHIRKGPPFGLRLNLRASLRPGFMGFVHR